MYHNRKDAGNCLLEWFRVYRDIPLIDQTNNLSNRATLPQLLSQIR